MLATAPNASRDDAQARRALELVQRMRRDYAHWATRCYRIRTKAGLVVPLSLNQVQVAIGAAEAELVRTLGEARIIVLKGRQAGVTTDQQARSLHLVWSRAGSNALTLTDSRDNTDKVFEITQRAVELFPSGLLPEMGDRETREISFPSRDSRFWTGTAGAKTVGRGVTLNRLHGSEWAFWDEPRKTLNKVSPALERVPRSVIVLETTASAYGDEAHEFWKGSQQGKTGYTALFFPWWECDPVFYRLPLLAPDELGKLEEDEQELVDRRGLDLEQLKWRRKKIAEMGRAEFLREYAEDPETCWLTAGNRFYDANVLKALLAKVAEPLERQMDGKLEIYDELPPGERAIIGADTAEGMDGDGSTASGRSFPSWAKLLEYCDSSIEPNEFADFLNTWGRKLASSAGPALLVVEKNMHGITVLRRLVDVHKYPANAIYHRIPLGRTKPSQVDRKLIGWHTGGESKPILLDAGRELFQAANEGHTAGTVSRRCLQDAFSVHRDKTGKVELTGRDVLVSELLAWMGRSYPIRKFGVFIDGVNINREEEE